MDRRRELLAGLPPTGSNLFAWAVPFKNPSNTAFSNATKRIFTPYTYCRGGSWSNYFNASAINSFAKSGGTLTVNSKMGYGVSYAIPVKRASSVTIHVTKSANGIVRACFYDGTGTSIVYGDTEVSNTTVSVPSNAEVMTITFCTVATQPNTDATFTDIKITPTYN